MMLILIAFLSIGSAFGRLGAHAVELIAILVLPQVFAIVLLKDAIIAICATNPVAILP